MEEINGIPIVQQADAIKPVLDRYGRSANDLAIRADILADIRRTLEHGDLDAIRLFLSEDEAHWIGALQWAYFQRFKEADSLSGYEDWARTKCDLLLAIASETRDDDWVIQHLLNYEDFHVEVLPFPFGPSFIVRLYELRGLDFFLFHCMGKETSAHEDDVLFDHALCVAESLTKLGRNTEAESVKHELEKRKERLAAIRRDFIGPKYDPAEHLIARIRIAGERFWSDYLTPEVWTKIERQSAAELVDAFSTEYLLKKEVLSTWSTVTLALCKVVERETSSAIFTPWKRHFQTAAWAPPEAGSAKERKRIESRLMTFKTVRACSSDKGHSPTLGQLVFIAKFWNDSLMDRCTDLFKNIRTHSNQIAPGHSDRVAKLAHILEQPLKLDGGELTISEARNCSAHPRVDIDVDWTQFNDNLRQILGKPPVELLKLVTGLSISGEAAQQIAAPDRYSATLHSGR